MKPTTNA